MLGRVTHAPSLPTARTLGALLGLGALTRVQSPIIVKSHESEVSPGGTVFPLLPLRTFRKYCSGSISMSGGPASRSRGAPLILMLKRLQHLGSLRLVVRSLASCGALSGVLLCALALGLR